MTTIRACFVGRLHNDGYTITAVTMTNYPDSDPDHMIPILRRMLSRASGDMRLLTRKFLTHGWTQADAPGAAGPDVADPATQAPTNLELIYLNLHRPCPPHGPKWLYLLEEDSAAVLVYQATVQIWWVRHSHHLLPSDPDNSPTGVAR